MSSDTSPVHYTYEQLENWVSLTSGMVGVAFMRENPEQAARVRAGVTGREHLNDNVAADITRSVPGAGVAGSLIAMAAPFLSRATREFTSLATFQHCEIAFRLNVNGERHFGRSCLLAIAVEQRDGVTIKPRDFHSEYEWRWLRCSVEQMQAMLWTAYKTQGDRFSLSKMNRTVTNPGPERRDSWFCVFHAMACLQLLDAPQFHMTRCNALTIDELFFLVDACNCAPVDMSRAIAPHQLKSMYGDEVVRRLQTEYLSAPPPPTPPQKKRTKKQKQRTAAGAVKQL